jgi:hypothetical protein
MNRIFAEQGYEFEGIPFGPAAGAISGNNLEEMAKNTEDVAKSLAEGVKYGSLTFSGGVGNTLDHYPVYYHNTITGQTVNSIGLANIGIDAGLEFQKNINLWLKAMANHSSQAFLQEKENKPLLFCRK